VHAAPFEARLVGNGTGRDFFLTVEWDELKEGLASVEYASGVGSGDGDTFRGDREGVGFAQ